ncbi:MAG: GTP-binding protein [Candidatus Azotimanducaceae bacterium]|jgi:GTP-binding protein
MSVSNPHLKLENATFETSAATLAQCPLDDKLEIAFCGRSNAGKSSAINYLTSNRKLARTSKTPGRTQLINFFSVSDSFRIVDLPGYGYAKVPAAVKRDWHRNIDQYLQKRDALQGLVLMMDIRHPLKEFDQTMIEWCQTSKVALHILLTKCDKLKRGAQSKALLATKKELPEHVTVQLFSSTQEIGKDQFIKQLRSWLTVLDIPPVDE